MPVWNEGERVGADAPRVRRGRPHSVRAPRRPRHARGHDGAGRGAAGGGDPGAAGVPERSGSGRAQRHEGGHRGRPCSVRPDHDGGRLRRVRERGSHGRPGPRGRRPRGRQPVHAWRAPAAAGRGSKRLLSRTAGLTLHWFAAVPIHDATNNFKLYSRRFLDATTIESEAGFELALELSVKATLQRRRLAEVPTTWRDRTGGESRFRLRKWLPHYSAGTAPRSRAPPAVAAALTGAGSRRRSSPITPRRRCRGSRASRRSRAGHPAG